MTSLDERKRALIARRLAEAGLRRSDPAAAPRRAGRTEFPLSFAQRRMWLHHQIVPDSTAFNLCIELTLDGDLDETALRAAFDALVARHEVLRTTYHAGDDGDPFQRVHDTPGHVWEVLDAPGPTPPSVVHGSASWPATGRRGPTTSRPTPRCGWPWSGRARRARRCCCRSTTSRGTASPSR
ncbi:condensation domain-containing protein [Pseudonocardia sp. ICBG1293]|uniref:condensation domain-containing protein n=1 Tax=Pseudonocardia sp. ICBG1293 TaxID=2844382 RepID=UPI002104C3B6|nr:condensation domain-containing protein [Pseudonocardia sp. ICBG1293]